MNTHEETLRESELAAEIQAQAEEIADLRTERKNLRNELAAAEQVCEEQSDAIAEVCKLLGQEGSDAADLHDAVGQIERLLNDQDRDGIPLTGLAAKLRQRLHHPTDPQLCGLLRTRIGCAQYAKLQNSTLMHAELRQTCAALLAALPLPVRPVQLVELAEELETLHAAYQARADACQDTGRACFAARACAYKASADKVRKLLK